MTENDARGDINISKIPASGIGGLGLVVMAGGIAWFLPELRWRAFIVLVGGLAVGLTLIGVRNRRVRRAVTMAPSGWHSPSRPFCCTCSLSDGG